MSAPQESAAVLIHPGGEYKMSIREGSEGERAVEIGKLRADTDLVTLDPGFGNTAACTSAITYIDGDAGILRYRGYPIDQLAEGSTFLETSYLLIYGELPTAAELDAFTTKISRHTMLHEDLKRFFEGFPRDAHPMPVLSSAVSRAVDLLPGQPRPVRPRAASSCRSVRLLAKLPTIAAYAYKKSIGPAVPLPGQLARRWSRTSCG